MKRGRGSRASTGRYAPKMWPFVVSLLLLLIATVAVSALLFLCFAYLGGSMASLWPPTYSGATPAQLNDITKSTVTAAGLIGGSFAVVYAYRKQRVEEGASRRSDEEHLSKRYQEAAQQLGHERAAVRLAGVYAMARLADDWQEQRQTCIDVLCAYLRMDAQDDDSEVRRTVCAVIRSHLLAGAVTSWSDNQFDFAGTTFTDVNFTQVVFRTRPTFEAAVFEGECDFTGMTFEGGADMSQVTVMEGQLYLKDLTIGEEGLALTFFGVNVGLASISFRNMANGAEVDLLEASVVKGDLQVSLPSLPPGVQATVELDALRVNEGAHALITTGRFLSGSSFPKVNAGGWKIYGTARIAALLTAAGAIKLIGAEVGPGAVLDTDFRKPSQTPMRDVSSDDGNERRDPDDQEYQ